MSRRSQEQFQYVRKKGVRIIWTILTRSTWEVFDSGVAHVNEPTREEREGNHVSSHLLSRTIYVRVEADGADKVVTFTLQGSKMNKYRS